MSEVATADGSNESTFRRQGYLYLAVNPSMEGLVKIEKTMRSPKQRIQELSCATGVPSPFILLFDIAVADCAAAEAYVHRKMDGLGYRVSQSREFFRVPTSEAVRKMVESESLFSLVAETTK